MHSSNDYPRGYEVYVSFDGGSWGKSVVTGKGTEPITKIKFDKPVKTRFIKILQTGSSDSWNWSIHECRARAALMLSLLATTKAMRLQKTPITKPSIPAGVFNRKFHVSTPIAPARAPAKNAVLVTR
ncbi:MAG: discoidin domain-containing protein, partial [Planctomycetota bacterium]